MVKGPPPAAIHRTSSPALRLSVLRLSGGFIRPLFKIKTWNIVGFGILALHAGELLVATEEILKPPIPPQVIEIRKVTNCRERVACFRRFFQPIEGLID